MAIEPVRPVGRLRRLADTDEGHDRGDRVEAAVDQGAQDGDRSGDHPDRELGADQRYGHTDAGDRRKMVEALGIDAHRSAVSAPAIRRAPAPLGRLSIALTPYADRGRPATGSALCILVLAVDLLGRVPTAGLLAPDRIDLGAENEDDRTDIEEHE